MASRRWAGFDWPLVFAIVSLCVVGSVEIFYATRSEGPGIIRNHLVRMALGAAIFLVMSFVPFRKLFSLAYFIYAGALFVLVLVLLFGKTINASKSWIGFGGVVFQPSETVKLVLILVLAKFLSDFGETYLGFYSFAKLAGLVAIPFALILLQHDLGTAITLIPLLAGITVLAGVRRKILVSLAVLGLFSALTGWHLLQSYQKARIKVLMDLESDPQRIGYQTIQAIIAIGSGGMTGKGLGKGSQGTMGFLPENHTDFIFALICEEMGLVGSGAVLLLYALLLHRGFRLAHDSPDRRIMYTAFGISTLYAFHFVSNVGMNLGLIPVIGIPLPPLSYGGSSLVTFFFAMGLLNNFYRNREIR